MTVPVFDLKMKWRGQDGEQPRLGVRFQRQAFRESFEDVGNYWFRHLLPLHFEPSAFRRYGYQKRSTSWNKRKDKLKARGKFVAGSETPNVATGRGREEFTRFSTVRAFPSRVKVVTVGPRYFRFVPRAGSSQPNKIAEITAANAEDFAELVRVFEQSMAARVEAELTRRANRTRDNQGRFARA